MRSDWRGPRRSVLGAFFAFGAFWGGWAVLVPAVQDAVGASTGALGLALLGIGLGSLPAMLLAGQAIDRWRFPLMPVALAAFALAVLGPALARTTAELAAALLLIGVATGVADVAINAEAASLERESGRPLMQLAHAFFSLGVIAGAVATGVLRQTGSGRLPIVALLAAGLLCAAVGARHPTVRPQPRTELARSHGIRRSLLLLGLACAAAFMVESGIENWSALYLQRELDAPALVAAFGPAAFATAMATGRLLGHRLRLDPRLLLACGGGLGVVGLTGAALAGSTVVAALSFFVAGLGLAVAAPTLFGAAGRDSARGLATVTTLGYLGFLVGPPLIGGMAELVGLRGAFAMLAGFAALLALSTPRLALGGAEAHPPAPSS